ncbi:MAG: hypothetical protein COV43_00290 [Deltaproteobacteria bacterium CG11_big_fil_rev_8_21_14_0_20_42_23]|nr:MAG: hypothetical protein COV43_00290 [Deltaproteobacteria bacterium CG11_big_fil_rev_8_21_14_0_20_42_23]
MACELDLGTLIGVASRKNAASHNFHQLTQKVFFTSPKKFTFIPFHLPKKKEKHLPHLMKLLDFEALFLEESVSFPHTRFENDFLYRKGKTIKASSLSLLVLQELSKEMKYTHFVLRGSKKTAWLQAALGGKKSHFTHKAKHTKQDSKLIIEISPPKTKSKQKPFISHTTFQHLRTLMALKLMRKK